jgi:hypothetical protein
MTFCQIKVKKKLFLAFIHNSIITFTIQKEKDQHKQNKPAKKPWSFFPLRKCEPNCETRIMLFGFFGLYVLCLDNGKEAENRRRLVWPICSVFKTNYHEFIS